MISGLKMAVTLTPPRHVRDVPRVEKKTFKGELRCKIDNEFEHSMESKKKAYRRKAKCTKLRVQPYARISVFVNRLIES